MRDILIVGAGHAGVEAAHISNKLGLKTTLVTFSVNDISHLPCNVSIGGSAKGIVVKELFALGGIMPIAADETQLQTKILNKSKGPAVRAIRTQVDKIKYPKWMKDYILNSDIELIEGEVSKLILKDNKAGGVVLKDGTKLEAKKVIIATGTFLRAKTMKGKEIIVEGPDEKISPQDFSNQLEKFSIELLRLKTGTPPRIKTNTIDFTKMQIEPGSEEPIYFTEKKLVKKIYQNIPAYLTYTNPKTHNIIKEHMEESYLYSDEISGTGPRYCPSIEDKVRRFVDKDRHQIFLEIESEKLNTTYPTGISSSMPRDVQEKFVRTIEGFENCEFEKYAYAIEYDAINPKQLKQTLELKSINNLYFAGQVNGTSGYEEAAAQGLWAAVNAANKIKGKAEFILTRDESYIGVMIDDITTKGIIDPYRLLTSRAEYRLLLRTDNAVRRLYKKAFKNDLISNKRFIDLEHRFNNLINVEKDLRETRLKTKEGNFYNLLIKKGININVSSISVFDILKRPEFELNEIKKYISKDIPALDFINDDDINFLSTKIKFKGYIEKQEREVKKYKRLHNLKLFDGFDFNSISNLATEAREKLNKFKPNSIDQASKIQGINPSDIMILIQFLNKGL